MSWIAHDYPPVRRDEHRPRRACSNTVLAVGSILDHLLHACPAAIRAVIVRQIRHQGRLCSLIQKLLQRALRTLADEHRNQQRPQQPNHQKRGRKLEREGAQVEP